MAQNQDGSSTSVSASLRLDYFSSSRELDDVSNVLGASLDVDLILSSLIDLVTTSAWKSRAASVGGSSAG